MTEDELRDLHPGTWVRVKTRPDQPSHLGVVTGTIYSSVAREYRVTTLLCHHKQMRLNKTIGRFNASQVLCRISSPPTWAAQAWETRRMIICAELRHHA